MKILKDRKADNISESEITQIAFAPRKKLITTCAYQEPILIRKYPFMKLFKKIIHSEKYYFDSDQTDYELAQIIPNMDEYKVHELRKKAESQGKDFIRGPLISPTAINFVKNDNVLVIGYVNGDVLIYDTTRWSKLAEFQLEGQVYYIQELKDQKNIAISTDSWEITFVNSLTWKIQKTIPLTVQNMGKTLVVPEKNLIFTIYDKKRIHALDMTTQEIVHTFKGHKSGINDFRLSNDKRLLASSGNDGKVCLFNAETGELIKYLIGHSDEVHGIVFSDTGNYLISSSEDQTLRIWDTRSYKCIKILRNAPNCYAMEQYGSLIVTGNVEGEIRTYQFMD